MLLSKFTLFTASCGATRKSPHFYNQTLMTKKTHYSFKKGCMGLNGTEMLGLSSFLASWHGHCSWHTDSEPCRTMPNHRRTRKRTKVTGSSLGSTAGTDTPSGADMVGCFPVEKMFPHYHRLSLKKTALTLLFLWWWFTTDVTVFNF